MRVPVMIERASEFSLFRCILLKKIVDKLKTYLKMSEDQGKLLQAVTKLRNLIDRGKLVLVIGEGASILPQPATIDDWWTLFPNLQNENVADILITKEQSYLGKQQHGQSRFHSVLRALGKFPLIITTNLDELLERFLWNNGTDGEKMCLNQIAKLKNCWSNYHRGFIVKCFGDSGFQTRASESHKEYFYSLCEKQSCDENSKFIRQLFDECSVLFLGVDADHPLYQRFINKFAVSAKTTHYIFKQGESNERTFQQHGSLLKLTVDLEIWEFAQHLSSGKGIQNIDDIQHGKIYEISFLATQRESYLKQQLLLEQHATEIAYHTTNITNALTTDELLEKAFRPSLVNIYKKDPFGSFSDNTVDKCLEAMHKRKQHLIQAINNGIKVIAVFSMKKCWRKSTLPNRRMKRRERWLFENTHRLFYCAIPS
uniref:Uncharacterized protein LOC102809990 n=1 Tax=Saccoglossus kowalevskii TaxID=10224 RepID=A0ABM0MR80_SACKO|nr:PREDICTED: uncharacterized protein LOC102809990 [Saccoglossus kowalevskii]